MTSSSNLIENIQTVSGIYENLAKKPIRNVCQSHKADEISQKMKAKAVLDNFMKSNPIKNDININWYAIKGIPSNLLSDYVPYRTAMSRYNQPRITNEIKCSIRKGDRPFS